MSEEDRIAKDAPFEIPKFDEKEFIRKELISFKTTLVLFGFSIVVAAISYAIWANTGRNTEQVRFIIHVLIAMTIAVASLRFIFRAVKIDIGHWGRKEWIGTFLLFFFFWLGFFLLLTNPPVTDASGPVVEGAAAPLVQAPEAPVNLGFYVADNVGVDSSSLSLCVLRQTGPALPDFGSLLPDERAACARTLERQGNGPFWTHAESFDEPGSYVAFFSAADSNGQVALNATTFEVGSPLVGVPALPRDQEFVGPEDLLSVRLKPQIFARVVEFSIDDGASWHYFRTHPDPEKRAQNWWTTDPSYDGWQAGAHQVRIRVTEQPLYLRGQDNVLAGVVEDPNGPYNITVNDSIPGVEIGSVKLEDPPLRVYLDPGRTPGFEAPLALVGLVGLVLVRRRRRDA